MSTTFDCGHGCKITCPDGGGCVYDNVTGNCTKFCNNAQGVLESTGGDPQFAVHADSKLTVHFQDVTPSEIARVLRELGIG